MQLKCSLHRMSIKTLKNIHQIKCCNVLLSRYANKNIYIISLYIFVNARNAAELIIIFVYTIPQKPLILHMYQGTENAIHNTALYQGICMNEQSDELFSHCFLNIVWNFDVFSLEWHRYMNKKITIDVTTFLEHYLAKTLTWSIKFWVIVKKPNISFYFQGKRFLIIKVHSSSPLYQIRVENSFKEAILSTPNTLQ